MNNNTTLKEKDAAQFLGFSPCYLRQARMRNEGPAFIRVGRAIRYLPNDLRMFLEAHRVQTHSGGAV